MPQPSEMWLLMKDSPVPAQIVLESEGAMASEPIDETGDGYGAVAGWSDESVRECAVGSVV